MPSGAAFPPAVRRRLLAALMIASPALLAGCGSDAPGADPSASGSVVPTEATEARTQLAGLAAAAEDRKLTALYTLSMAGDRDRTVAVTMATDGSWRVDIPGGALGGTADVAMAQNKDGLFQCALPSAQGASEPSCVRVGNPDSRPAAGIDPRVQHVFTDWRAVLTDQQAPLAVSVAKSLPGTRGSCFSVDSTSASLNAPLDVGIYCYDLDGTLTGARVSFGTLVLAGAPGAAPPTVTLPGPVLAGEPLGMTSPPTPPGPTVTPSATSVG